MFKTIKQFISDAKQAFETVSNLACENKSRHITMINKLHDIRTDLQNIKEESFKQTCDTYEKIEGLEKDSKELVEAINKYSNKIDSDFSVESFLDAIKIAVQSDNITDNFTDMKRLQGIFAYYCKLTNYEAEQLIGYNYQSLKLVLSECVKEHTVTSYCIFENVNEKPCSLRIQKVKPDQRFIKNATNKVEFVEIPFETMMQLIQIKDSMGYNNAKKTVENSKSTENIVSKELMDGSSIQADLTTGESKIVGFSNLNDGEFISDSPEVAGMIKKENKLMSESDLEKAKEQLENYISDTDAKISAKHIGKKLNDYTNEIIKSDMQKIDDDILEAYLSGKEKSEVVLSTGFRAITDISELKTNPEKKKQFEKVLKDKVLSKPFAFWCQINEDQLEEFKNLELDNLYKYRYSGLIDAISFGYDSQSYGIILGNISEYEKGMSHYGYKEDSSKNYHRKISFERMVYLIKLKDEMLSKPDRLIERRKQFFEKAFQAEFYYHELQEKYRKEFGENDLGFYDTIRDFAEILGYDISVDKKMVRIYKPSKRLKKSKK